VNLLNTDKHLIELHLIEFAKSFLLPSKIDRYCTLALSERGRIKWRDELDHFQSRLRPEVTTAIPSAKQTVSNVYRMLGLKIDQSNSAFVFSTNWCFHEGIGQLNEILENVVELSNGTVISIKPGKLALYWGEERDAKFLLRS
jgi:hypothetical protein